MLSLKNVKSPDSNFVNFPKVGAYAASPPFVSHSSRMLSGLFVVCIQLFPAANASGRGFILKWIFAVMCRVPSGSIVSWMVISRISRWRVSASSSWMSAYFRIISTQRRVSAVSFDWSASCRFSSSSLALSSACSDCALPIIMSKFCSEMRLEIMSS